MFFVKVFAVQFLNYNENVVSLCAVFVNRTRLCITEYIFKTRVSPLICIDQGPLVCVDTLEEYLVEKVIVASYEDFHGSIEASLALSLPIPLILNKTDWIIVFKRIN